MNVRSLRLLSALLLIACALPAFSQPVDEHDIARNYLVGRIEPAPLAQVFGTASAALTLDPFESVALSWRAVEPGQIDPVVRVRASADGITWSKWMQLHIDDDVTNVSEGHYASGIAHFGQEMRYLQTDFDRSADHLVVTAFPIPAARAHRARSESYKFGSVEIRSRADWGCPEGEEPLTPRQYTNVTHAVIHHTAGANSVADWDAEMRSIWYLHTVTNGWIDIGYNFLIAPNGVIYEGRAGGNGVLGAHFSCINGNTVGVALLGTYSTVAPTPAAIASLKELLVQITKTYSIDPLAVKLHGSSGVVLPTIIGHRDGNGIPHSCTVTECPGDAFYAMLPAIRSDVACAPVIEVQPSSITIAPGGSVTLWVGVRGAGPFEYQWYAGATGVTDSPLATTPSLSVSPSTMTSYWVRVKSSCGSADSATAIVNVSTAGRSRTIRH